MFFYGPQLILQLFPQWGIPAKQNLSWNEHFVGE